jgi:hypothetical protein
MISRSLPPQSVLLALLDYDQETGVLVWKIGNRRGLIAGTITCGRKDGSNRYRVVGINRQQYQAGRLIWKIMTGRDPDGLVDHKDGNTLNYRWSNLRSATNSQNIHNSKIRKDNKSGVKGVCWDASHKAWRVQISDGKRQLKLGRFKNLEDASKVAEEKRLALHGEFARTA